MDLITLSPPPASYKEVKSISITLDPSVKELYYTSDNTAPTLAKYLAYDNLPGKNPFIAVVQDGKGNVLFDGGFPKWYNIFYTGTYTDFKSLPGSGKYLYNALNFIANPDKPKKVLILNDAVDGSSYGNNTSNSGFYTSFTKVCNVVGFTPTFKCISHYGGVLNPTYEELDQYACVIILSTNYTDAKLITDTAISNLAAYRESGNGLFLITDHGESATKGFYRTANFIAENYGAYFTGYFDRSPVNVGYLRRTYGNHILFDNFEDSENIYAGGSESKVVVTQRESFNANTGIPTLTTAEGVSTFRFLLVKENDQIETQSFSYLTNIEEPIQFKVDDVVVTETFDPLFRRTLNLNLEVNNTDIGGTISGLLKYNSEVVGTFSGTVGDPDIKWLNNYNNIFNINRSSTFEIEIQSPIRYFKTLIVPIKKLKNMYTISKVESGMNDLENSTNFKGAINKCISIDKFKSTSEYIKDVLELYGE